MSSRAKRGVCFALATIAIGARPAVGQQPAAPSKAKVISVAFDVMRAARYATFVTIGTDGQPQSRIVDPLIGSDNTIWIGTNPLTRKVAEIKHDSRVTLTFFNAPMNEYVTVLAHAQIVTDEKVKAARWKKEWSPFYKEGARGPDFILLQIRPFRLEVSAVGRGVANDPKTWKPVVVDLP